MESDSLKTCVEDLKAGWRGLDSLSILKCQEALAKLSRSSSDEAWLDDLHKRREPAVELYRDAGKGFILLAHVEPHGLYRQPHNHGNGWAFYAVQSGEMEISTYALMNGEGGERLVTRGYYSMKPGKCSVFLPGDIHDTRCQSEYTLMFRLTSCDFSEEKRAGRLRVFS
ncbi:hypothetical protein MO867_12240 [Microbulbifer sp. OS29]|uniref:Cysteine dioxygenase type I n=1 Tax=Microbulbifer okhotskensis TaxID=2926617 RepID=A0A9X2J827_9GAMM|nr:hypothetical protein [Microbulbifer okhotskensis]MCO1335101.1 hypothetical protein [Microbulbifer okhotskensis]